MELKVKHFDELSTNELYEILKTRAEIFWCLQTLRSEDGQNFKVCGVSF